jgi:hypothetical protein
MRKVMRQLGATLLVVLICPLFKGYLFAQSPNVVFFQLQTSLSELTNRARIANSGITPAQLSDLQNKIDQLQDRVSGANPTGLSEYVKTLSYQSRLLSTAAQMGNAEDARAIIADVSADLDAKLASSASLGVGPSFRGVIDVTVHTKRAGTEASGYLIQCNPLRYRDSDPMFSFPNLSSPTTHKLPPGRYEVVAVQNNTIAARRVADIGLSGQDRVDLDVPVP